ncbi:hypothetical protein CHUAL_004272 [Chamberlinius hualienensis]
MKFLLNIYIPPFGWHECTDLLQLRTYSNRPDLHRTKIINDRNQGCDNTDTIQKPLPGHKTYRKRENYFIFKACACKYKYTLENKLPYVH